MCLTIVFVILRSTVANDEPVHSVIKGLRHACEKPGAVRRLAADSDITNRERPGSRSIPQGCPRLVVESYMHVAGARRRILDLISSDAASIALRFSALVASLELLFIGMTAVGKRLPKSASISSDRPTVRFADITR